MVSYNGQQDNNIQTQRKRKEECRRKGALASQAGKDAIPCVVKHRKKKKEEE